MVLYLVLLTFHDQYKTDSLLVSYVSTKDKTKCEVQIYKLLIENKFNYVMSVFLMYKDLIQN